MYTIGQVSEMFHLPISTLRHDEQALDDGSEEHVKALLPDRLPEDIQRAYDSAHSG